MDTSNVLYFWLIFQQKKTPFGVYLACRGGGNRCTSLGPSLKEGSLLPRDDRLVDRPEADNWRVGSRGAGSVSHEMFDLLSELPLGSRETAEWVRSKTDGYVIVLNDEARRR